jgi:hypothetical protein
MTFFSFRPADFSSEGGGLDDIVLTIRSPKIVLQEAKPGVGDDGVAYNIPEQTVVTLSFESEGREPTPWTFRIGSPKFVVPTKNGRGIMKPDGTQTKLSGKCDLAEFVTGLLKSGMSEDVIPAEEMGAEGPAIGIMFLDGLSFHNRMEKRKYVKDGVEKEKKSGTPTPVKFVGKSAGGNGAVTTAASGSTQSGGDDELGLIIVSAISTAPNPMTKIELNSAIQREYQKLGKSKDVQIAAGRALIQGDIIKELVKAGAVSEKGGLIGRP